MELRKTFGFLGLLLGLSFIIESFLSLSEKIDTTNLWNLIIKLEIGGGGYFLLGIIALTYGIFHLIWYYNRYNLSKKGIALNTKISKIDAMGFYTIHSEYKEGNNIYHFKSPQEFISKENLEKIRIGDYLKVYVKPGNYSIYLMDTKKLVSTINENGIISKPSIILLIFGAIIGIIGILMAYGAYFFNQKQTQEEVSASYVILGFSIIFLIIATILLYKFFKHSSPKN